MTRLHLPLAISSALACTLVHANHLEEIIVTGSQEWLVLEASSKSDPSPDPAQLLRSIPGVNINRAGPVSGLPQIRGMFGTRVATTINGQTLGGAGPNAMDPPISYATGQLQELKVYRGIAPVSAAQESIGGAIEAQSQRGEFTASDQLETRGSINASTASVDSSYHLDGGLYIANRHQRFKLGAMTEAGDDATFTAGDILPTEYQRQRYDLGWGLRTGSHQWQLDYTRSETGDAGTPSLPMDIQWIDGDLFSLEYQWDINANRGLMLRLYGSELDHGMTNYHLRQAPTENSRHRKTLAESSNRGFKLSYIQRDNNGQWHAGIDGFHTDHDTSVYNPNAAVFFVRNFQQAQRDIVGLFIERQQSFSDNISAEWGLRLNQVDMDANPVNATPAMMMPAAKMLRDAFNNADRAKTDTNIDAVAKLWYATTEHSRGYLGLARKTRSPAYQERYLWLPMQSTGGLADGLTYTGQINLKPEVAHEIELGLDYAGHEIRLSPRLFYRDVSNYIQGIASDMPAAIMMVNMMNKANGTNNPSPLRFANVEATLYGFDMDMRWSLTPRWMLDGQLSYVRGKRDDVSDNLYRIAPLNAQLNLTYSGERWSATVETVLVDSQNKVSSTNREPSTSGYAITHVRGQWQASTRLTLTAGINNLFDTNYRDHLSAYNRVINPDIAIGERLPGYGVSAWMRASYEF